MKRLKDQTEVSKNDKLLLSKYKNSIQYIDAYTRVILYGLRARIKAAEESDYDTVFLVNEQN